MSWGRSHFHKEHKPVRRARLSVCTPQCADCLVELPSTHVFFSFEGRCKHCFHAFVAGAVQMASRMQDAEREKSW